jgi:environmental stress-induced protein Ves
MDYVTSPWKNGLGSTDEICLLPDGANRDAFDLRVSRATIDRSAAFSAFPGADRTITLIEGHGLELDFGDRSVALELRQGCTFDSGLTPVGVPVGGPVRVVNVMVARRAWGLGQSRIIDENVLLDCGQMGELRVLFALRGAADLTGAGETVILREGDSALVDRPVQIALDQGAALLMVPLARAPAG